MCCQVYGIKAIGKLAIAVNCYWQSTNSAHGHTLRQDIPANTLAGHVYQLSRERQSKMQITAPVADLHMRRPAGSMLEEVLRVVVLNYAAYFEPKHQRSLFRVGPVFLAACQRFSPAFLHAWRWELFVKNVSWSLPLGSVDTKLRVMALVYRYFNRTIGSDAPKHFNPMWSYALVQMLVDTGELSRDDADETRGDADEIRDSMLKMMACRNQENGTGSVRLRKKTVELRGMQSQLLSRYG